MNFSTVRSQGERKAGTQLISSFYPDWDPTHLQMMPKCRVAFPHSVSFCVNTLEDTVIKKSSPTCWGTSLSSAFSSPGLNFLPNLGRSVLIVNWTGSRMS